MTKTSVHSKPTVFKAKCHKKVTSGNQSNLGFQEEILQTKKNNCS